jgi:geranylgeranyl reductase family protein
VECLKTYDVVVVGAGPAGSTAANVCAKSGLDVLLLDKDVFPRTKPCGGGVSNRTLRLLRAFGVNLPDSLVERKILGFQLVGPDLHPVNIYSNSSLGCTVIRSKFDHFLVQEAVDAGATFLDGHRINNIEQHKNRIVCHTNQGKLRSKLLIGADGVGGRVARALGLRGPLCPELTGIAVEADVPIPKEELEQKIDPNILALYFLNIPLGYAWAFPRRAGLSLGLGGVASQLRGLPKKLRGFARLYARQTGLQIPPLRKIVGHPLPAIGFKQPLVANRVLLVGDAAGFVDIFTGQGLCYAVESGILAGRTVIKAIQKYAFSDTALSDYTRIARRRFGEELRLSRLVAVTVHNHLYGGFRLLRHIRGVDNLVKDIAAGQTDYYRLLRNPLNSLIKGLLAELRARFKRQRG